ncbi:MAG: hypothetical protein MHM6MM_007931, partial [Cercozoa sp. M6MM]
YEVGRQWAVVCQVTVDSAALREDFVISEEAREELLLQAASSARSSFHLKVPPQRVYNAEWQFELVRDAIGNPARQVDLRQLLNSVPLDETNTMEVLTDAAADTEAARLQRLGAGELHWRAMRRTMPLDFWLAARDIFGFDM